MQQPRSCLVSDYDHGADHHNVYHDDDDDDDHDDCSALLQSILNLYYWSIIIIYAREDLQSDWFRLFVFSPLCVFKCVFKRHALEDAKSHCNCSTFIRCAFSNVS